MITDDEREDLPEDPELAFVQIERVLRANLRNAADAYQDGMLPDHVQIEYITRVLAAKSALRLDILDGWQVPRSANDDRVFRAYSAFTSDVDHFTMEIRVRHARRNRQYSVALDAATKAKLRHHLQQIKETVDQLELNQAKKDAFYRKIESLDAEINSKRTRFDAIAAAWIEACGKVGDGFERLEPVRRFLETMAGLVGRAKETEESQARLPAPEDRRKLPAPAPPVPAENEDDVEIPF